MRILMHNLCDCFTVQRKENYLSTRQKFDVPFLTSIFVFVFVLLSKWILGLDTAYYR